MMSVGLICSTSDVITFAQACKYNNYYVVSSLGRGVFTTKKFSKDDFLLVYKGELVTADEGYRREDLYHPDLGSFLFFF